MPIDFNYVDKCIQNIAEAVSIAIELAYNLYLGEAPVDKKEIQAKAKVIIDRNAVRHYYWDAVELCSVQTKDGALTITYTSAYAVVIAMRTHIQLNKLPIKKIYERYEEKEN